MDGDRASGNTAHLVRAEKDPPSLNLLRERIACWEAQKGNRGAAEQAVQEARRALEANASRNRVTEITREVSLERLDVAERQVRLAFDEDAAVYTMATNALPRLVKLGETGNDPLVARVQVSFRKHALDEDARSALNLGRYAEAETAARALLSFPPQTDLSDRSYLEPPADPDWGRVLLAQAAVEQSRKAEALQTLEPALSNYHDAQAQGAAYIDRKSTRLNSSHLVISY